MTITTENNKITISNLFNNIDISRVEEMKTKFSFFNCTEFSIKKIVIEPDSMNYDHQNFIDFDLLDEKEQKNRIMEIVNLKSSLEIFMKELLEEVYVRSIDGTGFVYFDKGNKEYFMDLDLFKDLTSKMYGNLHNLLDISSFNIYLDNGEGIEIIEKWNGYNELWCGGLVTTLPNKKKMKEITSFSEIEDKED